MKLSKAASPIGVRSNRHTDRALTDMLIGHYQDDDAFIADKVFPTVPVKRSTDFYYEIPRGHFNRSQMQKRARGAEPTIGNFDYTKTPFLLEIYALMVAMTDEDEVDMDDILEWDIDATMFLNHQAKLRREISFTENFFKAGVWGSDLTGVTGTPSGAQFKVWNDAASTPIKDIKDQKRAVLEKTGIKLNTLTIDEETKDVLLEHPEIIDRINGGQTNGPAKPTLETLKALFEVEFIHVGYAIQNNANEGASEDSHAFIMSKGALLTYTPRRVGKRVATSGYNFVWGVYSPVGMRMRQHRADLALTDFRIIDDAYAQKAVSVDLGVFFSNTVQYS